MAAGIKTAIDADPRIPTMNLTEQFNKLVLGPLSQLKPPSSQVVRVVAMVDALDECDREQDQQLIVSLLASLRQIKSVETRFFLTSRPELPLRLGFKELPECVYEELTLHEERETEQDIELFLRAEFVELRVYHSLPLDWPDEESLQKLVKMAVPLFVFAATACRFIADKNWDPLEQMKIVLEYQSEWHVWQLDRTYLPVLHQLITDQSAIMQEKLAAEFRLIVGAILNLATPLSISSLSGLLSVPKGTVGRRLEPLHSVLDVPRNSNTNTPVRAFHASFRDFLFDERLRDNSKFHRFWINNKESHRRIYISCVELMSSPTGLVENMCGLKSPGVSREDVEKSVIEKCLPAELQYACRYWVHHLVHSDSPISDNGQVHNFLQKYLLRWLEAMSLLDEIGKMIGTVASLNSMLHAGNSKHISALLYDIKRFILQNTYIIEKAPLQVYFSALIFTPNRTLFRSIFDPEVFVPWVSRLPHVQDRWSASLQILEGHADFVNSVAFSPNGKILASASDDSTIRLWDTNTGMSLQTLQGHTSWVQAVAYSADGKVLISGSRDTTVRMWDVANAVGSLLQILYGHTGYVTAVAISADGYGVASGSDDQTVRLWDAVTGAPMQILEGHTNTVTSVAFSIDSKMLASASYDQKIKLWDAKTGVLLQNLEGCKETTHGVTFSPNNAMLASASENGTVILWDAATRTPLRKLQGHKGRVYAASFSTDGKLLATGGEDQTVKMWDTVTGSVMNTFYGHASYIKSVMFSPGGEVVASASIDRTVRLWDAIARTPPLVLYGDKGEINVVALSADGKLLGSAYSNKIDVSDTGTGELLQTLVYYALPPGYIARSIVFSPDCKVLASAYHASIIIWDVTTGAELKILERDKNTLEGLVFSPDGKILASKSSNTIRIWDLAASTPLGTIEAPTNSLGKVALSVDGGLLASIGYDRIVRLWEVSTGTLLRTFTAQKYIPLLSFSQDNRYINAGEESFHCQWNQSPSNLGNAERNDIQHK
ncbi:hypothetical protein H072_513 [Dactylellina haptotyla CBS 200.50]|uniref:Nephrocystin 3-like N-terminal domain-containing protein n=1 Tax=Dactylellina haptotyla (strain CBS 200.50) TaxID=1284197 RepID=S8AWZ1_DACHA|nr:hypothetical protein H072_513 [Dactylellina haptotyla CBS 200.50]